MIKAQRCQLIKLELITSSSRLQPTDGNQAVPGVRFPWQLLPPAEIGTAHVERSMTTTSQVWVATGWEEEYQHQQLFARQEDALACASRWKDDLLESVEVRLVDLWEEDVLPF